MMYRENIRKTRILAAFGLTGAVLVGSLLGILDAILGWRPDLMFEPRLPGLLAGLLFGMLVVKQGKR